jgi:hypothetical protein
MKFTTTQARAIARGAQTTLTIPAPRGKAGAPYAPCRFKVDHDYPLTVEPSPGLRAAMQRGDEGADNPPLGHVRVVARERRPLHITVALAKTEGHDSIDAMKKAWVREHDRAWIDKHHCDFAWARYVGHGTVSLILLERFRQRWEGREVWTVCFSLATPVRFLARPVVRVQGDYTPTVGRAIDELPAIDKATQDRYSKDALGFCIGRQLNRAKELERDQAKREGERRPYPKAA